MLAMLKYSFLFCSVPTFHSLPEEILSKLADVLEEVNIYLVNPSEQQFINDTFTP